jgi:hypothetical protein
VTSDPDGVATSGPATRDPGEDRTGTPSDADEGRAADGRRGADADGGSTATATDEAGDPFGGRGWLLVVAVVVSTLVIPAVIYVLPSLLPSLGLPYVAALLVLPMAPAVLLGLVAVWSMAASGRQ